MENRQNSTNINWFPGHMAKAIREMKEKVNIVDMVIELVDARAPVASINPVVKEIVGNKFYLKVFTKIDLADDLVTEKWGRYYQKQDIDTAFVNLNKKDSIHIVTQKIKEVTKPLAERDMKRGLKPRSIRVMVVGIPNVGKSTFINTLAKKKSAGVANRPGFTKSQKWVHCDGFELLDTPGILWPNLTENQSGIKLALIGCIRQDILPLGELVEHGLELYSKHYANHILERYGIAYLEFTSFMEELAKKRGHLLKNNELDMDRTAMAILNDMKNGQLGKTSVERVEELYGEL